MKVTSLSLCVHEFLNLVRLTVELRKAVRNSVSGQADCCKALEAHPLSEEGNQVCLIVVSPAPVRAATQTLHSLCGKGKLIN